MPKDKKSYKIQTKKSFQFILPSGSKGFIATCHRGRERKAKDELLQLFEEWFEKISVKELDSNLKTEKSQEKVFSSIEEELEEELAELKDKKTEKLFSFIDTSVDCLIFVKVNQAIDPVSFMNSLLTEMQVRF
jgi:tRNA acetyltransferase TAN1